MTEIMSPMGCEQTMKVQPPAMIERLRRRKANCEEELQKVNEAIASLEKHPEVAEAINAISRLERL